MKRPLILLGLILYFAIGCQNDTTNIAPSKEGTILNVSLAPTRVTLGEKEGDTYPAYWSEGDRLVVNGQRSEEAIIDSQDSSNAAFEFSATPSYPFNITYPYCAATTAEQSMVEFPAEQSYVEGSFEAGSAPMCGYATNNDSNLTLNHLTTILHFLIKAKYDNTVLDRVVITSANKIAGTFKVDCQNASISATESCVNTITYSLPENFALSTTTPSDLFIVLPAVEVGTCEVQFIDASGEKMTATWSPSAPLLKGVVHEFKTISYLPKAHISLPALQTEEGTLIFPLKKYASVNEIKIMSFNIRTAVSETDPANNWDNRKAACVDLIEDQLPTIIGFQEAKYSTQWVYLKTQLSTLYDGYGVNRDSGAESGAGEVMGILYLKNVIEKIDGGTFWLSETPDVPSKGFGANYSRNATWGLFKHKPTGKIFYYINTHLDHQVANAQIEGMKLISKYFEKYKDSYPLFLTGDLNIKADNVAIDPIESYMYNTREAAPAEFTDFNTTYNGYKSDKNSIIDHIYCSNHLQVMEYHTINDRYGTVNYVSDHYPIYAIVKLP